MPAPRATRLRSDKHLQKVTKRGVVSDKKEKKGKAPIGPLMIGFFLFVVVGSSVLQIIQMAGMGGKIAQQMENQQPRDAAAAAAAQEEADARGGPLSYWIE